MSCRGINGSWLNRLILVRANSFSVPFAFLKHKQTLTYSVRTVFFSGHLFGENVVDHFGSCFTEYHTFPESSFFPLCSVFFAVILNELPLERCVRNKTDLHKEQPRKSLDSIDYPWRARCKTAQAIRLCSFLWRVNIDDSERQNYLCPDKCCLPADRSQNLLISSAPLLCWNPITSHLPTRKRSSFKSNCKYSRSYHVLDELIFPSSSES